MSERIEPLGGHEIISDLLAQIEDRLKKDCNLRQNDAYGRGYSAKVHISLELYGMDTTRIDQEYPIGIVDGEPDAVVTEKFEIPIEPDLNAVRDRSDQEPVNLAKFEAPSDPNAPAQPLKRRYQRATRTMGMTEVVS